MARRAIGVLVMAAAVTVTTVVVPSRHAQVMTIEGRSSAYPSIASSGGFLAVTWGATNATGTTDVYAAVSRDAGRTFGSPTRVNDEGSQANLSGEQPPSLTLVTGGDPDPSLVVTWTSKTPAGTRLLSARSDDGGRSFAQPTPVPGSEGPGNRGWQATATDREGRVASVWLDHRELATSAGSAPPAGHGEHQHGAPAGRRTDSVERAQFSKLLFARQDDHDALTLTGGVCYCCKTASRLRQTARSIWRGGTCTREASAISPWRHPETGVERLPHPYASVRTHGSWMGCPENGPALTVDAQARVHVAWPTLVQGSGADDEPTLALFHAQSHDGQSFAPRQRVPTEGVPRHVRIVTNRNGSLAMVWEEGSAGLRRVALGLGVPDASGRLEWQRRVASGRANATYPVLAPVQDGVVAAWVEETASGSVIVVERIRTTR